MAKKELDNSFLNNIDPYSILMDLVHNLVFVVIGTIAAGMLAAVLTYMSSSKTYTTSATFAVTDQQFSNYASFNTSAASEMASTFSNVLASDVMKQTVAQDIGLESFDAEMTVTQITDTNLLKISVSADSPQKAYLVLTSLMKNYNALTKYVSTTTVLDAVQEPQVPQSSASSLSLLKQKKIMLGAFVLLCALFIFLSLKNDTVKSEEDFKNKLDTKRIGTIDHLGGRMLKNKPLLITDASCNFGFTEKYRKIAASIRHSADMSKAKIIMFTSVAEHEGKSTVAANTALTLAKEGYKVILIDEDLRRPSIGKMFDLEVEAGYSFPDLASGKAKLRECMKMDEKSGLFILSSRSKGYKNSTEIVASKRVRTYIEYLKDLCDYIILDTPPMGVMADAESIAQYAEISVLVVKYDMVQASNVNDAIDVLNDAPAEYIGAVFNDLHLLPGQGAAVAGYGAYGKYGSYGSYGRYGNYGKYGNYGHYGVQKNSSVKEGTDHE